MFARYVHEETLRNIQAMMGNTNIITFLSKKVVKRSRCNKCRGEKSPPHRKRIGLMCKVANCEISQRPCTRMHAHAHS